MNADLLAGLKRVSGSRLRRAELHEGDDRVVAVSARGFEAQSAHLLAHLLHLAVGRELHLVVPRRAVDPTRARAAFLNATVHVHTRDHRDTIGDPLQPMTRDEAIRYYRRLGPVMAPPADERRSWPGWLVELVDWVERYRVERVRTTHDHAWRYRGRQVLSVRRTVEGTYTLVAGADLAAPDTDSFGRLTETVPASVRLPLDRLQAVQEAIEDAIERRRTGQDDRHRESLLKAALGTDPSLLGLTNLQREVPARRPLERTGSRLAYIDFLGRDVDGVGHIIETKVGPDPLLGIQALDYWAWVEAHRDELATLNGADPAQAFRLDLVLGRSGESLFHPAAIATIQAFRDITWCCHLVEDWDTIGRPNQLLMPTAVALPTGELPPDGGQLNQSPAENRPDG